MRCSASHAEENEKVKISNQFRVAVIPVLPAISFSDVRSDRLNSIIELRRERMQQVGRERSCRSMHVARKDSCTLVDAHPSKVFHDSLYQMRSQSALRNDAASIVAI
jgi:hypothetical protein